MSIKEFYNQIIEIIIGKKGYIKKRMTLKEIIRNKIYDAQLSEIQFDKKCIINAFNPHSYCMAKKDKIFKKALLNCDILLPDGSGIVLATKILTGKKIKKIAGADMHLYLLNMASENKQKIFYFGSTERTLQLIIEKVKTDYPNIKVSSYSPPFKSKFSKEDTDAILEKINAFKPDILFVGLTAPKQEKWVYVNKNKINARTISSIGAAFDFYAGTVKRSNRVWIKLGLEWLPRLLREPKRLWRRNLISTPQFLWDVMKEKVSSLV